MGLKRDLKKIFIDLIPVAIGVYVGILASNWNENIKKEELKKTTIERIQNEINKNKNLILNVKDYHVMVGEKIDKMPSNISQTDTINLKFWKGLRIPRLQKSVYQTAMQTGAIAEINFDLLENINNVYLKIERYNEFSKTASQGLYANDFSDLKNTKKIISYLRIVMTDLYYLESEAIESFDLCLSKMKQK